VILRHTVLTKLACLFHLIVNISFSYDVLLIKTALIWSANHLTVSNHSTLPILNKTCTITWFRGKQYSQNSPVSYHRQHFVFLRFIYSKVASVETHHLICSLISPVTISRSRHWLCKNSKQRRSEDVVFVNGPWSRVRQQAFSKFTFLTAQSHETISSITERMIRTLSSRIWRYFKFKDTERYVDVLPDFSRLYNATFHCSIKRCDRWWLSHNQPAIVQQISQAHCLL